MEKQGLLYFDAVEWLCSNVTQSKDASHKLFVGDLHENYESHLLNLGNESLSQRLFYKCIYSVWPETKTKTGKKTNEKGRCYNANYLSGFHLNSESAEGFDREKIISKKPKEAMVMENKTDFISFGLYTSCTRGGSHILKELSFSANGMVSLRIKGNAIFSFQSTLVDNIFQFALSLKLCEGIAEKVGRGPTVTSITEGGSKTTVSYAHRCKIVVIPIPGGEKCQPCQNRCKNDKKFNERQPLKEINSGIMDRTQLTGRLESTNNVANARVENNRPHNTKVAQENANGTSNFDAIMDEFNTVCTELHFTEKQKLLMNDQARNLNLKDKRQRRWHPKVLWMCLTMWCRGNKTYTKLRDSGFLLLPHPNTLAAYKNNLQQEPGVLPEVMEAMRETANHRGVPTVGRRGGLFLDEMSIAEDIQMISRGMNTYYSGLANTGTIGTALRNIRKGYKTFQLADHVLQFVFVGSTGFRYPVAHWPVKDGASPSELTYLIWDAISLMGLWDFTIDYIGLDGAVQNRQLIKLHFMGDPMTERFTITNPFNRSKKVTFYMDPKHNIKKIRGSALASGMTPKGRRLKKNDKFILWSHWEKAYTWDKSTHGKANTINRYLTNEHIWPNNLQRMRNKLAEQVLDSEMLYLMKEYQKTLTNPTELDETVKFLSNTAIIVKFFNTASVLTSITDDALVELMSVLEYFMSWESNVNALKVSNKEKRQMMLTAECREDIKSMIVGVYEVSKRMFEDGCTEVVKHRMNNDVVENMFSMQRCLVNGPCKNPNAKQYAMSINTITASQEMIVSKTMHNNSGNGEDPYSYSPVKRRKQGAVNELWLIL